MLQQYLSYKQQHPESLLFFQVGDFYELFFEDAVTCARLLNLTLTSRDKNDPDPVPMAGVPVASIESYVNRLVAQGLSVAIVSQEEGKQNAAGASRSGVQRRLDRMITPGVNLLSADSSGGTRNIVAAVMLDTGQHAGSEVSIAYSDVQSGVVHVREGVLLVKLAAEISRLQVSELIIPSALTAQKIDRRIGWVREIESQLADRQIKFRPESYFALDSQLREGLSETPGYLNLTPLTRKAVRLLLGYIDEVTVQTRITLREIRSAKDNQVMTIDSVTRRTLELVQNAKEGTLANTLFSYMNLCCTAGGSRLLYDWILSPSADLALIENRQAALKYFLERTELTRELSDSIKYCCDIERVAARIDLQVVGPRELAALRDALKELLLVKDKLAGVLRGTAKLPSNPVLDEILRDLDYPAEIGEQLNSLAEKPAQLLSEGGIIRVGFNFELDRLKEIGNSGQNWIVELEAKERQITGIASLKIKYNNVLGYFFEVTQSNLAKVPAHFIRRQGTANAERFTSEELRAREKELVGAETRQYELERELFCNLRRYLCAHVQNLRSVARAVSALDVLMALAQLAQRDNLVCPELDNSKQLSIVDGQHPVLARILKSGFVANSLNLNDQHCALVTGPNMGGKSTFLRQTALIVIMSQLGSFVPAKSVKLGLVDQVFARMGASDDLSEGQSTFMLEMREVANILANASARSLVLVDEVGRGTATADGFAIARAVLEWLLLHVKCRSLFATHFHELTTLSSLYPELANLSVGAVERDGQVFFTHQIQTCAASKSYGLEVARLAGLPEMLLERAFELLSGLHNNKQLQLFSEKSTKGKPLPSVEQSASFMRLKKLQDELAGLPLDNITPLQALNILVAWQREFKT